MSPRRGRARTSSTRSATLTSASSSARSSAPGRPTVARHAVLRTAFRLERDGRPGAGRARWRRRGPRARGIGAACPPRSRRGRSRRASTPIAHRTSRPSGRRCGGSRSSGSPTSAFASSSTYHHALLDGRAVRVVLRELFDCYEPSRGDARSTCRRRRRSMGMSRGWPRSRNPAHRAMEGCAGGIPGPTSPASPHAARGERTGRATAPAKYVSRENERRRSPPSRGSAASRSTRSCSAPGRSCCTRYGGDEEGRVRRHGVAARSRAFVVSRHGRTADQHGSDARPRGARCNAPCVPSPICDRNGSRFVLTRGRRRRKNPAMVRHRARGSVARQPGRVRAHTARRGALVRSPDMDDAPVQSPRGARGTR